MFVKYPKIRQFSDTIKNMRKNNITELSFYGTVKLHGTNGAIIYNVKKDSISVQSRNRELTIQSDNFDFAQFIFARESIILDLCDKIKNTLLDKNSADYIYIYGEYAGKGIQRNMVGIDNIKRSFFVFDVMFKKDNVETWGNTPWHLISQLHEMNRIYSIRDFETYATVININYLEDTVKYLNEMTNNVEHNCPIANKFGFPNQTGEGIVWSHYLSNGNEPIKFKVKGEKHSVSDKKVGANIDTNLYLGEYALVNDTVNNARVMQAISEIFQDQEPTMQKTGEILRWINNDIIEEEKSEILENNLNIKKLQKLISSKAVLLYKEIVNNWGI